MNFQEILSYFENPKPCGNGYKAKCPAHNDNNPSLSITDSKDRTLICCHKGCSIEDVLSSLGLKMSDLFYEHTFIPQVLNNEKSYLYHNIDGEVIARKQRRADKSFYWYIPDENGGWKTGLNGLQIPPYNLPNLLKAQVVFIVEGEKDADTLINLGRTATTAPNGAGSKWHSTYNDYFSAKSIIILPDNDDAGRKYAETIAKNLLPVAASVKILDLTHIHPDLPDKGDISDIFVSRKDDNAVLSDLDNLVAKAPSYHKANSANPLADKNAPPLVFKRMVDILPKKTTYLVEPYLPAGRVSILTGIAGTMKTYLALYFASCLSTGTPLFSDVKGENSSLNTLYISWENDPEEDIRPRLEKLGANLKHIFVPEKFTNLTLSDSELEEAIMTYEASLVVIDPLQSFLGSANLNRTDDMRPLLDKLGEICKRTECAVLLISHMNKKETDSALNRINGSADLRNFARNILMTGYDPNDDGSNVLAHAKNNMGALGHSVKYRYDENCGIVLGDICDLGAEDILLNPPKRQVKKAAKSMDEAKRLLNEIFLGRDFVAFEEIKQAAENSKTTSIATVYKAKTELGISSHSEGFSKQRKTWWIASGVNRTATISKIIAEKDNDMRS